MPNDQYTDSAGCMSACGMVAGGCLMRTLSVPYPPDLRPMTALYARFDAREVTANA